MSHVINSVRAKIRDWSGNNGPMKSIDGDFVNGDGWSINCKPGNETQLKADLEALVGKPPEGFTVEAAMKDGKQREYNGKPQWNLKKQQQGGFRGGGSGYKETYAQSRECKELEQRSIQRSVALDKAMQFCAAFGALKNEVATPEYVLSIADKFFPWLHQTPPASEATPPKDAPPAADAPLPPSNVNPTPEWLDCNNYFQTIAKQHPEEFKSAADVWLAVKDKCQAIGLGTSVALKQCRERIKFDALKKAADAASPVPW